MGAPPKKRKGFVSTEGVGRKTGTGKGREGAEAGAIEYDFLAASVIGLMTQKKLRKCTKLTTGNEYVPRDIQPKTGGQAKGEERVLVTGGQFRAAPFRHLSPWNPRGPDGPTLQRGCLAVERKGKVSLFGKASTHSQKPR